MIAATIFNEHVQEYEDWFEKYPYVFRSEVAAIKKLLPAGKDRKGLEIGVGTGRFAKALHIQEGIDPSESMREVAAKRGVFVLNAMAEKLPHKPNQFDFVLMNFCVSYFDDLQEALREAHRVLKTGGVLVVGFVDKNSPIAHLYERRAAKSAFYKNAKFYSADTIAARVRKAGFAEQEMWQTLFHLPARVKTVETALPGKGKGSYIFIKAVR